MTIILPLPPTMNSCYRNVAINRRIMTDKARSWVDEAQLLALQQIKKQGWACSANRKIVCEVIVYFKTKARQDVENRGKLMWDTLQGIVYEDDKMLLPRYMNFFHDKNNPRVELNFFHLED